MCRPPTEFWHQIQEHVYAAGSGVQYDTDALRLMRLNRVDSDILHSCVANCIAEDESIDWEAVQDEYQDSCQGSQTR